MCKQHIQQVDASSAKSACPICTQNLPHRVAPLPCMQMYTSLCAVPGIHVDWLAYHHQSIACTRNTQVFVRGSCTCSMQSQPCTHDCFEGQPGSLPPRVRQLPTCILESFTNGALPLMYEQYSSRVICTNKLLSMDQ